MGEKKFLLEEEFETLLNSNAITLDSSEPVMIYLSGCAFLSISKHLDKPYDSLFYNAMQSTLLTLCKSPSLHSCVFGYTAGNTIAIILSTKPNASPWLGYDVHKMCSVAASIATMAFYQSFSAAYNKLHDSDKAQYMGLMNRPMNFEAVSVNVPVERAADMIYWMQRDRNRHAVQELGRCFFAGRELKGLSNGAILSLLKETYQVDFNAMPTVFKRGVACKRVMSEEGHSKWTIDDNTPFYDNPQAKRELNDILSAIKELYHSNP